MDFIAFTRKKLLHGKNPGAVFSFFAFPDQGLIRIFQKFYHVVSGGSVDEDVVVLRDAAEGHALFVAGQFLQLFQHFQLFRVLVVYPKQGKAGKLIGFTADKLVVFRHALRTESIVGGLYLFLFVDSCQIYCALPLGQGAVQVIAVGRFAPPVKQKTGALTGETVIIGEDGIVCHRVLEYLKTQGAERVGQLAGLRVAQLTFRAV